MLNSECAARTQDTRPLGSLSSLTGTGAHACLHHLSFLRVSAFAQSYRMMADFVSLSS